MLFARPDGRADHIVAMLAFWAMGAGFVRGVGFIPRHAPPRRYLFSAPMGVVI